MRLWCWIPLRHVVAAHAGEDARLRVEGDVGGGLLMRREFQCSAAAPETLRIASSIEAAAVGAGSGGFSRSASLSALPASGTGCPKGGSLTGGLLTGRGAPNREG